MKFLRVCRRIYLEAHNLAYRTTAFQFDQTKTLHTFCFELHHLNLRYLHIKGFDYEWNAVIKRVVAQCLELKVLHLETVLCEFFSGWRRFVPLIFTRDCSDPVKIELAMDAADKEWYRLFEHQIGLDSEVWRNTVRVVVKG